MFRWPIRRFVIRVNIRIHHGASFLAQLGERENIDQIFLASEKQLRANKNGNLFMQLRLSDRSGSVRAMMWNANDNAYRAFENGDYVRIEGATQFYNGSMQIIVSEIDRVDARDVDPADFQLLGQAEVEQLAAELAAMLRSMQNLPLRNLAECFLIDEAFMQKFTRAPAGVKNHHAYLGGLLDHVVSLMRVVKAVTPLYSDVDGDLLLMGAFLHDMGKIDELTYERDLGYSDAGQLLGHLVQAISILDAKLAEAAKLAGEPTPAELELRLKHMILSHHGQYEYGSPKLPMTLEAVALHQLDNLDAKLHSFQQLMQEDANVDSPWTAYHAQLGRKLYKGSLEASE